MKKLYDFLTSLDLGIWLVSGVMLFLGIGSFIAKEGSAINDVPLFIWLTQAPPAETWWLWITVAILAVLALNTVLCSIESLRAKWQRGSFLIRIAPQLMHLGFLLIMLAHLSSAYGGFKDGGPLPEGGAFSFPDGSRLDLVKLDVQIGPMGMPLDFSGVLRHSTPSGVIKGTFSPNHPYFYKGFGVYLKNVEPSPVRTALVEIHREPGAPLALAGALFFTVANLMLIWLRRGKRAA
ncbi:cytochrome C biogenesis protein ResB [Geobacter pelophilus]|uniref:Cytochrome C biogenesis protein ResB n=1 Tax=Geoanaerobacter pelophilus TaxID=60036 RepID=A0AAW4LA80_9BACT|nr:cytochrome C biogenesis protein ResB [Geoanaerobacter pelophilus]MBT0664091.1 cytochrome C biogenesis protein ResB [Geoanaerobacter pelophilus]